jgi:hypothetical protein
MGNLIVFDDRSLLDTPFFIFVCFLTEFESELGTNNIPVQDLYSGENHILIKSSKRSV